MPNEAGQIGEATTEILIEPLAEIVRQLGQAIAESQQALDRNSIAVETELADLAEELGYDLHATWYHMPETNVEIRMFFSMHWEEQKKEGKPAAWRRVISAAPLNASYKNLFDCEAGGTSTLKVRIVSIPPASSVEVG